LLSVFQHTSGDLLNGLWFERCAAFYRHVDVAIENFSRLIMVRLRRDVSSTPPGEITITSGVLVLANSSYRLSVPIGRAIGEAYSSVKHL
jgi:hypothetical protein